MNAASLHAIADAWAETLWRASWQGAVVILGVWLACKAWRKMPATLRWWLWQIALLKLIVALVWISPLELKVLPSASAPDGNDVGLSVAEPLTGQELSSTRTVIEAGDVPTAVVEVPTVARFQPFTWVMLLWSIGCAWCVARLYREWRAAVRLRTTLQPVSDPAIQTVFDDLGQKMGFKQLPPLAVSDSISSPLVLGFIRPVIVLPATFVAGFASVRLRLALAHELIHVARRDLVWNWLPFASRALFFFHPLVWLAHREWRLAREIACDEAAVRAAGSSPGDYAEMLADAAEIKNFGSPSTFFAMGIVEADQSLKTLKWRIHAMNHIRPQSKGRIVLSLAATLAAFAIALIPWRITAQDKPADRTEKNRPTEAQPEIGELTAVEVPASAGQSRERQERNPARRPTPAEERPANSRRPATGGLDVADPLATLNLQSAQADIQIARAELEAVKNRMNRLNELVKQKAASMSDVDDAKTQLAIAEAKLRKTEAIYEFARQNHNQTPSDLTPGAQGVGNARTPRKTPTQIDRLNEADLSLALRQYERVRMEAFEVELQRDMLDDSGLKEEAYKSRMEILARNLKILHHRADELRRSIKDMEARHETLRQ